MRLPAFASLLLASLVAVSDARADDPLWAAVESFRAARYEEACQGFEALREGHRDTDYGTYLGPTYYKLGRFEDARLALAPAYRRGDQDPVATYYLALTYYRLGFQQLARRAFEEVRRGQPGSKLGTGAQRFLEELARSTDRLGTEPIAAFVTNLEAVAPDLAFDYAMEAMLRATTPREIQSADQLVSRLLKGRLAEARAYATRLAGHGLPGAPEAMRDLGMAGGGFRTAPRFHLPDLADRL